MGAQHTCPRAKGARILTGGQRAFGSGLCLMRLAANMGRLDYTQAGPRYTLYCTDAHPAEPAHDCTGLVGRPPRVLVPSARLNWLGRATHTTQLHMSHPGRCGGGLAVGG